MMKQAIYLSFALVSLVIPFLSVFAKESIVYFECSQLYSISTKAYESNVNTLFTSLISSASISSFNKFEISPQSDVVYGLFQCRGDLSYHDCKDCVENSVSQLKKTCPKSTSGTIQLEGCFIKYDNTSFFGVEDKLKVFKRCGPSIGYNSDTLTRIDDALAYLVGKTGQYFRVGVLGSVQGMMQCVQDLNVTDCEDCVLEARGRVRSECETSTWGDMYLGKCYIRYADGSFRPVKGIGVVNINEDLHGGTRKSKNIKKVVGIVFGILLGTGVLGFTLSVSVKVYRIRVKKEVTIVRQKVEEVQREAHAAREEAKAAQEEVKIARRESESQKLQIDTLSRQRDWYKSMSSTGRV
ncbi:plasmodesmata-located protein 6 [Helianthus annuus]|nr:plasmodesmata-located protein 6 [Helianthus annuus]